MNDVTFSVIVPTAGRRSLRATLASVADQLEPGDEILVLCDDSDDAGDTPRMSAMPRACGSHLVFIDDDDQLASDALRLMRDFAREHPGRIGIFRMRYRDGGLVWAEPVLRYKNVSTQTFLVPNIPGKLGTWKASALPDGGLYAGDFTFITETARLQGDPIFVDEIVAHVRSDRRPLVRLAQRLSDLRYRLAPRTRLRRFLARTRS
jgi:glycosyltransferase involved in cell wall biosynthesis